MKKLLLLSVLLGAMPITMMAQDDLYFTPKKGGEQIVSSPVVVNKEMPVYHSGSNRNVDEYNRRGAYSSYFQKIGTDSLGNDIIEFHTGASDIIDTLAILPGTDVNYQNEDDYNYSRRITRFDDYYWDPWYYNTFGLYRPYWGYRWGWYNSWYDWYDPWYYGWYDPWYYERYGFWGWGSPYYYYSWGYPYWYGGYGYYTTYYGSISGGGGGRTSRYVAGTNNHGSLGRLNAHSPSASRKGNFGGYRGNGQSTRAYAAREERQSRSGNFGGYRGGTPSSAYEATRSAYNNMNMNSNSSGSFGGSRGTSSSSSASTSTRSSGSYSSGGSYGGSRTSNSSSSSSTRVSTSSVSSGGSFGGSRSSGSTGVTSGGGGGSRGGGSFGGRR